MNLVGLWNIKIVRPLVLPDTAFNRWSGIIPYLVMHCSVDNLGLSIL